jgi:hypothetical protein
MEDNAHRIARAAWRGSLKGCDGGWRRPRPRSESSCPPAHQRPHIPPDGGWPRLRDHGATLLRSPSSCHAFTPFCYDRRQHEWPFRVRSSSVVPLCRTASPAVHSVSSCRIRLIPLIGKHQGMRNVIGTQWVLYQIPPPTVSRASSCCSTAAILRPQSGAVLRPSRGDG